MVKDQRIWQVAVDLLHMVSSGCCEVTLLAHRPSVARRRQGQTPPSEN